MTASLQDIWVYLAASPLLSLTMTLIAYQAGLALHRALGGNALVNPVLVAVALIVTALTLSQTSYETYFEGAQFVHFLLGPATVALALPLYRQFDRVRRSWLALSVAILSGSLGALVSTLALGTAFGLAPQTLAAMAPKSVTAPVAMSIAQTLGGAPSLAAVLVIATGIVGASLGPLVLDRLGIVDPAARGAALGTASHGIGTARALQESEVAGAFSGLAMGLNAVATAVILPLVWWLWFG